MSSREKLEVAIIENLQREDLNPVERARAFSRLVEEFKFTHTQIGQKMGKSREYVSNTLRLLTLPQDMLDALSSGKINEGHTRPLLMLASRPEEQATLFKEITIRKITVREAERIARRIAVEKVRKHQLVPDGQLLEVEQKLQEALGTRVHIIDGEPLDREPGHFDQHLKPGLPGTRSRAYSDRARCGVSGDGERGAGSRQGDAG